MEQLSICHGCLASDRHLETPEKDSDVFALLAPHLERVCWECRAQLRRLRLFRDCVLRSGRLLQEYCRRDQSEEVQRELITRQCRSTLTRTNVTCYNIDPECSSEEYHNHGVKSEFLDVCPIELTNEVALKSEPQFDLDDDVPLINHRSLENDRKVRKNPQRTRKVKRKLSDSDVLDDGNTRLDDVDSERLSDNHIDESAVDDGIFDDIADDVKQEETMALDKSVSIKGRATKRTRACANGETKRVKGKKKPVEIAPEGERYRAVLVSEEELAAWRAADARHERYTSMRLPHKCTACLLPFRWREQLVQHNLKKHDPSLGEFACDVCAVRFPSASEMAAHRALHLARYECLHCAYVTRDKRDIDKHYEVEHCEAKYKCTICGEAFKTFFQQRYHREAAHRPLWKCQHCDKSFRLRGGLYSHMRTHQTLPKAECPVCGKVYKNKYALMYHLRVHEVPASPLYCRECDVHFKSRNQLRLHNTTSMKHVAPDELKFPCQECGRRFITEKRREHHYDSVHLNKTEFPCGECSKAYANKQSLRSHVLRKHKQTTLPRDKICDICGKGFHNNVLLRNHMRTHTGERPFHCKICPSTFSYSAALYTHNRLVHLKLKREKPSKKKATVAVSPEQSQWEGEAYTYQ